MNDQAPKRPPLELEIKLDAYRRRGEKVDPRVLFTAGVPQCVQTAKDESYGNIRLYDDMTENDVIGIFRSHKKERQAFLRGLGKNKRKYLTKNAERDREWVAMASRYKDPPFVDIARRWATMHPEGVKELLLAYLWDGPKKAISYELEERIAAIKTKKVKAKKKRQVLFKTFSETPPTDPLLKDDIEEYVQTQLHHVIRAAVQRALPVA